MMRLSRSLRALAVTVGAFGVVFASQVGVASASGLDLSSAIAPMSIAAPATATPTPVTEGPFAIGDGECPGINGHPPSERCPPIEPVDTFISTTDMTVVFNHPGDCSAIILHLFVDEKEVGATGAVNPGESGEVKIPWPNDGVEHELGIEAEGVAGGCNSGEYLHAWAGEIEVTYTPPPSGTPELSIAPVTVAEPASGTSTANFPVTLSAASQSTVSVEYATQDGSGSNAAIAPHDYEETHGTLTFSPGETSKTIPVTVPAAGLRGTHTFSVTLSNAQEASIATGKATGTIISGTIIVGSVVDRKGKPSEGVTVTVAGTSDEGAAVSQATKTNSSGKYSVEVLPGKYAVTASGDPSEQNGGNLDVAEKSGIGPAELAALSGGSVGLGTEAEPEPPGCTGSGKEATCTLKPIAAGEYGVASFTYTYCNSTDPKPNDKAPTGCPIIFIPGFLGSRIKCSTGEQWTNGFHPIFSELGLEPDGKTNAGGSCGKSTEPIEGEGGVLTTFGVQGVYTKDVYGGGLAFLNRIAPGRVWAYTFDWRKSPPEAVPGLEKLVDRVLSETDASRVVIMAHSMGGLVTQAYLANDANAKKVTRVVTLGTPYWGAPKSHVPLLTGHTDGVAFELMGLDIFAAGDSLQRAVRNMLGLYWLYPSAKYGPWLNVVGPKGPNRLMASSEIGPWVSSLGGNASLIGAAQAGHAGLDGFKTNGVDYEIVVGTGLPTITSLEVEENEFVDQWVTAKLGSGDGTVPARSATQGAFDTGTPPGDNVPIHYVCDIEHMALTSNPEVQTNIEGYLLKGKPILESPKGNCPITGAETQIFKVSIPNHGLQPTPGLSPYAAYVTSIRKQAAVATAKGSMTLQQAAGAGLIQLTEVGGKTIVVSNGNDPSTLEVSGHGLAVSVRSLTGKAPTRYYRTTKGPLSVTDTGVVKNNGKTPKALRSGAAPHTTAHVKRHGRQFIVRLTAKDAAGVAGTYIRIGTGASKLYTKPLRLTKAQLKRLRYASVNTFGRWERSKKAKVPH